MSSQAYEPLVPAHPVTHGRDPIRARPRAASGDKRKSSDLLLWFDTAGHEPGSEHFTRLTRALQWQYTGVVCYPHQYRDVLAGLPRRVLTVLDVQHMGDLPADAALDDRIDVI